ncbi:MAG TPA: hypothetical protein VGT40_01875 [Methylomirabilota bacterium]|jgi:hypothetical protein|nr:hypothetical protein [Methylomirabilota bacterium]
MVGTGTPALLLTAALALVAGFAEAAAPAAHATATASSLTGGWTEVLVSVQTGEAPWRGSLALAGRGAKLRVALAVPARGQRVLALSFWMEPGDRAPAMWLDDAPAGSVAGPTEPTGRMLVAELPPRLPMISRAYEAFDLVVLPAAVAARLSPPELAALERWVTWGGAVAVVRPDAVPALRPVARGAAIVAASVSEARAAFDRSRGARHAGEDPALAVLRRWERSRLPLAPSIDWQARPGGALAVFIAAYVAALGAVGLAGLRLPAVRRAALHLVVLLVASASLAVWGVARAGSPAVAVRETTLVAARPDGEATLLASALRVKAQQPATTRWQSLASVPMLYEVEPRRGGGDPQRAVRWDADGGVWERAWALGETAVIRSSGGWPDLGIRLAVSPDGEGWRVENHGAHTLRRVVVVLADRSLLALGDVPPSGVAQVPARRPSPAEEVSEPFWDGLLSDATGATRLVLLAALDPPIASARFVDGGVRVSGETRIAVSLPSLGGSSR